MPPSDSNPSKDLPQNPSPSSESSTGFNETTKPPESLNETIKPSMDAPLSNPGSTQPGSSASTTPQTAPQVPDPLISNPLPETSSYTPNANQRDPGVTSSFQPKTTLPQSPPSPSTPAPVAPTITSTHIGRFLIQKEIGKGAYGTVYLCKDEKLKRTVAIKVPHPEYLNLPGFREDYLKEAQVLAQMKHPSIVEVLEISENPFFLVSNYIEGTNLEAKIKQGRMSFADNARLVEAIALGLQHAHSKELVHRDLKPANILIDLAGKPYIADFGMALHDDDFGKGIKRTGTPLYNSPEQARSEGHRVDGRSDIFSLGIILYELLTGKHPFLRGKPTREELFHVIIHEDPKPPQQFDGSIPKALSLICGKCLAKDLKERYQSGQELADDLAQYLSHAGSSAEMPRLKLTPGPEGLSSSVTLAKTPITDLDQIPVVPKGLRSFEKEDASFFLALLPGARRMDGLPESIHFWKTRIERKEDTFSVGLIFGPSGCGKSSLVKAGLLPHLDPAKMLTSHLEAAPGLTEKLLLEAFSKLAPNLAEGVSLKEAALAIRLGRAGIPAGKKVLIVIDQFEQWLYERQGKFAGDLADALRQFDGVHVQCILLVRDDFSMPIKRFMRHLEIPIVPDRNEQVADLFDKGHATKVLLALGRGYGRIAPFPAEPTADEKQFLKMAIDGLAQEERVISVRLAMFAQMMKSREWTPASFEDVGGVEGLGISFLEETFGTKAGKGQSASLKYAAHQKAAQGVLKVLLPEVGTDIKGQMRSPQELQTASGYEDQPEDFAELISILDREIRLITPIDPEARTGEKTGKKVSGQFYQLAHDYLVPSIRDWLRRKQKESAKGRAEILIGERAALWKDKKQNRQLPSLPEYLRIAWYTKPFERTQTQKEMLGQAGRYHGIRTALSVLLLAGVIASGWVIADRLKDQRNETQAEERVKSLLKADTAEVPKLIAELEPLRQWANPLLQTEMEKSAPDSKERLHTSLALLESDPGQVDYLMSRMLEGRPQDVSVLRAELEPYKEKIVDPLWVAATQTEKVKKPRRLRAAAALALYDPESSKWKQVASLVASDLVSENPVFLGEWTALFRPVKKALIDPLELIYKDRDPEKATDRSLATNLLADYAEQDPQALANLAMDADERQFGTIFPKLQTYPKEATELIHAELARTPKHQWKDPPPQASWKPVSQELINKITQADGLFGEQWVLVQTLPLGEFAKLCDDLSQSGFRPTRLRPYSEKGSVRIAALWNRDGRPWRLVLEQDPKSLDGEDQKQRKDGYAAVDVAGYLVKTDAKEDSRFGALWVKSQSGSDDSRIYVGVPVANHKAAFERLGKEGYTQQLSLQGFRDGSGLIRLSGVRSKESQKGKSYFCYDYYPNAYSQVSLAVGIPWDVSINLAGPITSPKKRYLETLAKVSFDLLLDSKNPQLLMERALAKFNLGKNEDALRDFTTILQKSPKVPQALQFRAIVHGRLGKPEAAESDRLAFEKTNPSETTRVYLRAILLGHAGKMDQAVKDLNDLIKAASDRGNIEYDAACAFSILSEIIRTKDPKQAEILAVRAVTVLGQAIEKGYSAFDHMETDSDLDPVRDRPDYTRLVMQGGGAFRYNGVWKDTQDREAKRLTGLTPAEHRRQAGELIAQGYRPVAVSVCLTVDQTQSASIWHRHLVTDDSKETLAKRQAAGAVALLRLGQAEKVWPLFRHSPDPRVRSYLIHRLFPLGADPEVVIKRLDEERHVSAKRALLLALGEFDESILPQAARGTLLPKIQSLYQEHPDPGLHAASEWLLRQWGQNEWLAKINGDWANDKKDRETKWKSLSDGSRKEGGQPQPQWFVNSQGQTMITIPGPVEFLMGSPTTEKGRGANESQHKKRVPRTFALSSKAVTWAQWLQFAKTDAWEREDRFSPSLDCPANYISWHMAARYCNWLSKEEGLNECYEIDSQGMVTRLKANFLNLNGYRLPTEAEMEFAIRAGSNTARFFGETDELLPKYTWGQRNSQERTWPVGRLKPNDLGLFDAQGNVFSWCQDQYQYYPDSQENGPVIDGSNQDVNIGIGSRVLRGGSLGTQASYFRSANRNDNVPSYRGDDYGFRPARTITP